MLGLFKSVGNACTRYLDAQKAARELKADILKQGYTGGILPLSTSVKIVKGEICLELITGIHGPVNREITEFKGFPVKHKTGIPCFC